MTDHPKKRKRSAKSILKAIGPGIVTGAADDDPSGIGTYTQAGAQFGSSFLWTALVTWPLMAVVQAACARIGLVTGEGLAAALKKRFPKSVLMIFCIALALANSLNVGADLSAMADEQNDLYSTHSLDEAKKIQAEKSALKTRKKPE